MTVKKRPIATANPPQEYVGLTADTTSWMAAHIKEPDGSTYRELDGSKRMWEIQEGIWYIQ